MMRSRQLLHLARVQIHHHRSLSTIVPFKLADIGEGIAEVELMKWFVKKGDAVKAFDRICEVQSDKATVEITSRYDGIISAVHFEEGSIVQVGLALVDIETKAAGANVAVVEHKAPAVTASPMKTTCASAQLKSGDVSGGDIVPFKLADIGEGIAEVELMQWFVKKGDVVKAFDRICEVQSDKATVEITSRYDGVIAAVHYKDGDIVKVGDALVDIQTAGAPASAVVATVAPIAQAMHVAATVFSRDARVPELEQHGLGGGRILTTPAVRRIAKEHGLNLSLVAGTGPKGRILKEDVLLHIKTGGKPSAAHAQGVAHSPAPVHARPAAHAPASVSVTAPTPSLSGEDKVFPIRGVQRLMVKSMTAANQVPHMTYTEEVVFDNMIKMRNALKEDIERRNKAGQSLPRISYLPILLKATSLALNSFPQLNASISSDASTVTHHAQHNIGVAMDTPKGLVVPVVKGVQNMSIFQVAAELARLQEAASKGQLSEADMQGGTFSLSNIGSIGGVHAVPVLVVPQVVIAALGRMQTLPRYVNSSGEPASSKEIHSGKAVVAPVSVMNVSWSADHRVVDGATIARFSNLWKSYLESPLSMVSDMK